MVEGRIQKTLTTMALMEADYIKDPDVKVSDLVKSAVAKIGENIQIRRFERCVVFAGLHSNVQATWGCPARALCPHMVLYMGGGGAHQRDLLIPAPFAQPAACRGGLFGGLLFGNVGQLLRPNSVHACVLAKAALALWC